MFVMLSCVGLFLLVFVLVSVFHAFLWNVEWSSAVGLRCWVSPYECGFMSQQLVVNYFSYTCFVLLVFFVVFDLEVSLLLNLPLQGMLYKNLMYYLFFLVLLCFGYAVEVYKGYALWVY
uniref:NADH-ubiquinone oxidoreductase chain 3 n=1 Tax=Paramphistomum cervi TaxID=762801 RepID=V5K9B3_PARCE|nr:NADH dehydrogenase subunit 3 [Paramphistomum cervi]AGV52543.1 NADH dehydrogenase subunit 3 [Paramphistomum cervi]ALC75059.1 NADH dehydrogenase subunit 3 [Paramphistomum cervi]